MLFIIFTLEKNKAKKNKNRRTKSFSNNRKRIRYQKSLGKKKIN